MRIALDLDDVLAELIPYLMQTHARLTGQRLDHVDVTGWDVFVREAHDEARFEGGYGRLNPVDGARDLLVWLRDSGHDVYIVSYRSEDARAVTEEWLAEHIGDLFVALHLVGGSKVDVCRRLAVDLIVDDSKRQVTAVTQALDIPGILVRTHMNRDWTPPVHIREAYDLRDVRRLVQTLDAHGGKWPDQD